MIITTPAVAMADGEAALVGVSTGAAADAARQVNPRIEGKDPTDLSAAVVAFSPANNIRELAWPEATLARCPSVKLVTWLMRRRRGETAPEATPEPETPADVEALAALTGLRRTGVPTAEFSSTASGVPSVSLMAETPDSLTSVTLIAKTSVANEPSVLVARIVMLWLVVVS